MTARNGDSTLAEDKLLEKSLTNVALWRSGEPICSPRNLDLYYEPTG